MELDDHDFPVVRKNLNIISVLILVLAYTNAKLNKLSFLGIDIELDAHKLYIALFVLYAYFIWRFLTKLNVKDGFWGDFLKFYMEAGDGVLQQHNFDTHKDAMLKNDKVLKDYQKPGASHIKTFVTRFAHDPLKKLRVVSTFSTTDAVTNSPKNIDLIHDFETTTFYIFKKLIRFCIKYDKFGDYLFPIIPVLVNLSFFVFASEWQGSIKSLWFS